MHRDFFNELHSCVAAFLRIATQKVCLPSLHVNVRVSWRNNMTAEEYEGNVMSRRHDGIGMVFVDHSLSMEVVWANVVSLILT